ncbi:MAG: hypothetical protein GXP55_09565 [Deltaproteobacteria bacterium]|nr:hypothetical protein [Deltaproteobacteria bacterium]
MQKTRTQPRLRDMSRAATRHALLLAGISLSIACGGSASSTGGTTPVAHAEVARRQAEPIDYLPADSFIVAQLNLNRLRSSPYISFVDQWLELLRRSAAQSGTDAQSTYERILSIYRGADSVFVGVAAFEEGAGSRISQGGEHAPPRMVLVLHGSFAEGELEGFLRDPPGRDHENNRVETRDGHLVVQAGRRDNVRVLLADANTVVLAVDMGIEEALAVANGAEPQLRPDGPMRALASQSGLGEHVLDVSVLATPEARRALAERAAGSGDSTLMAAFAETLEHVTAYVALADGIQIGARIQTSNRLSAVAITQQINQKLEQTANQPALMLMGLAEPVRSARAHVDGTASVIELSMDDGQARALLERIGGLVNMLLAPSQSDPQPINTPSQF